MRPSKSCYFIWLRHKNQLLFAEIPNIAKLTQLYGQPVKQGLLNQHQIWYWNN